MWLSAVPSPPNADDAYLFGGGPGTLTVASPLADGSSPSSVVINGNVVLSNTNNTYSGGTSILGGTLQVACASNLGSSAATITFAGGTLQATGPLDLSAPIVLSLGGGTIDTNGCNVELDGQISGAGSLTVLDSSRGNGTLLLTSANSYASTDLEGGTLQVGNASALGGGDLTVNGTLDLEGY